MHPADAEAGGFGDGDLVDVVRDGDEAHTLFCDVVVRVSPAFTSELHMDADEGHAAGLQSGSHVGIRTKPA
jgi:putative phosphotransacetylase